MIYMQGLFDEKIEFEYFYESEPEKFVFYKIPAVLFTDPVFHSIDTDAKLIYSFLLDRAASSAKNGFVDKQKRVYVIYRASEAINMLHCSKGTVAKCFSQLVKIGLIEKIRRGQGLPDIIYVKNFAKIRQQSEEDTEVYFKEQCERTGNTLRNPNFELQEVQNETSRSLNFRQQEIQNTDSRSSTSEPLQSQNLNPLYINQNTYTENTYSLNKSYHFNQSNDGEKDTYAYYKEYLTQQLELDTMLKQLSSPHMALKPKDYEDVFNIILDTLCKPGLTIRINGGDLDAIRVKERLMQLAPAHVIYVLTKVYEAAKEKKIKNIRAYTLTCLYYSFSEMNLDEQASFLHHFFSQKD